MVRTLREGGRLCSSERRAAERRQDVWSSSCISNAHAHIGNILHMVLRDLSSAAKKGKRHAEVLWKETWIHMQRRAADARRQTCLRTGRTLCTHQTHFYVSHFPPSPSLSLSRAHTGGHTHNTHPRSDFALPMSFLRSLCHGLEKPH